MLIQACPRSSRQTCPRTSRSQVRDGKEFIRSGKLLHCRHSRWGQALSQNGYGHKTREPIHHALPRLLFFAWLQSTYIIYPRGPSVLEKKAPELERWRFSNFYYESRKSRRPPKKLTFWVFHLSTHLPHHRHNCSVNLLRGFQNAGAPRHWWDGRGIEPLKWS